MLEVIDKGRVSASHPVPILFVHGAWHAAWCWDEHFLDFFAARGYRALALSLRGHGGSATSKPLRKLSFADYLDDIVSVTQNLPGEPIIVGHSMGGFLVQRYLQSRTSPAGILMASMPPSGYLASGLRWLKRHPWHFTKVTVTGRSLPYVGTPALARERFFSAGTPEAIVRRHAARLQEESGRSGLDGIRDLPKPKLVSAEMLVLGALDDGAVTQDEVRATAAAYRTQPEFFPGMGHDMMLEPGWEAVANRIHSWLATMAL
ncbi:MAG: alpha/beta hydrolase [Mycolicibacterium sp.]|uniref:alpha/beta hydrolase n=1 Tax=Mycolicibacterium sp. TaxID=2320850 RepID=UPI003D1308FE